MLLGDLARAGFEVTDDHEESDAIIVNTCAFVEDAKSESLEVGAREGSGVWRVGASRLGGCRQRYRAGPGMQAGGRSFSAAVGNVC